MLEFNNTETKQGLLQHVEIGLFGDNGYGQITNDTNRLAQFTARFNLALNRLNYLALTADGSWNASPSTNSNFNVATHDIVSGQRDYALNAQHLIVDKVFIKNASGSNTEITSIDQSSPDTRSYLENNTGNTGTPYRYDIRNNSIVLDPTPNYAYEEGIEIWYKGEPNYFTTTDTTKTSGYSSVGDSFLIAYVKNSYAKDRQMITHINTTSSDLIQEERMVSSFFTQRSRGNRGGLRTTYQSTK
jgi:hypothetical protein